MISRGKEGNNKGGCACSNKERQHIRDKAKAQHQRILKGAQGKEVKGQEKGTWKKKGNIRKGPWHSRIQEEDKRAKKAASSAKERQDDRQYRRFKKYYALGKGRQLRASKASLLNHIRNDGVSINEEKFKAAKAHVMLMYRMIRHRKRSLNNELQEKA
jgi:hypothetical protein